MPLKIKLTAPSKKRDDNYISKYNYFLKQKTFKRRLSLKGMKKTGYKTKSIASILAGIFFIAGFIMLNKEMTGNVIFDESSTFNPISLIGLLLVICSAVLVIWIVKSK